MLYDFGMMDTLPAQTVTGLRRLAFAYVCSNSELERIVLLTSNCFLILNFF